MSELKEYIDMAFETEYSRVETLSENAINQLVLYRHNKTGRKLVLIQSTYRNDSVFRRLKGLKTDGLMPQIYEVSSEEDYLYVLEEYVEGETLSSYLEKNKQFNRDEIKSLLLDICRALSILHHLHIVHRDIKPENIIVRANGKACLIDFSVAKTISNTAGDTMNLGTAGYAAPEQYGISQSLPTTDIYALGVLANILATGTHPTAQIAKGKLGIIIKKCTNIQIAKRFQSAEELEKALRTI